MGFRITAFPEIIQECLEKNIISDLVINSTRRHLSHKTDGSMTELMNSSTRSIRDRLYGRNLVNSGDHGNF